MASSLDIRPYDSGLVSGVTAAGKVYVDLPVMVASVAEDAVKFWPEADPQWTDADLYGGKLWLPLAGVTKWVLLDRDWDVLPEAARAPVDPIHLGM